MLIGDLSHPDLPDSTGLLTPCPRMSLLRIFFLKVRVTPIEGFSPSQFAGSAQPGAGDRAIEDWPQSAGLPPVSGSSDVDIIRDHPSPADMDFIPDTRDRDADGYNTGPNPTRDRDADRYKAGPNNPLPSSGTQDRGASRYNAGSNPPNTTSGTRRPDAGRETAGPNPSSTSSRNHAGLFAAFNRRETPKESAPDVIDLEEQSSHHASEVLSPKPFIDDVAQRLDLTQPDHDRAQLRGSSSLDFSSGQTGTDSRATKRSSESSERRKAALRLRSIPPAHHDPIDVPIHSAGSGLSSNAPMSEKETGSLPRPGTGDSGLIPPSLGMEGSHRIHRLTTPSPPPSFKSELRVALLTGMRVDGELVTLTAVLPLPLPQMRAILSPLSFSDSFSRFTTRSRGARLKSRGAELRFVHVGMISAHALVRSRRSTTALTPSRERLSLPFLPSPERSRDTRPSSVKSEGDE